MSALTLTPSIEVSSPPEDNRYFTPLTATSEAEPVCPEPQEIKDPQTTPVSSNEVGLKVRNLRHLLNVPSSQPVEKQQRRNSFSLGETKHLGSNDNESNKTGNKTQLGKKRRHASEGETGKFQAGNQDHLNYTKYQSGHDGLHHCDGWPFHFCKNFLKTDSPNLLKSLVLQEIKQILQGLSPEITPGQTTLSHTDLAWEVEDEGKKKNPALMSLLDKINKHVQVTSDQTANYNGIRITYAFDRSVAMNLHPVNNENIPLVVLHIGRARDLCFTPTRFSPANEGTDLCDVVTGNFSVVVIPYKSSQHLRTYFANESAPPGTKDEQILLIPFYEREAELHHALDEPIASNSSADRPATTTSYAEAAINADAAKVPTALPIDTSQSSSIMATPRNQGLPDTTTTKPTKNDQSCANSPPIKLFCTTIEMMRGVINDLKKPALKSWASTCGIPHSSNPVANKRKLCELLEKCSTSGSTTALSLLKLLTKKLKDHSIKLELTANQQPLSLTAAQRKSDLVQYYENTYHKSTTIDFLVLPDFGNVTNSDQINANDIPPTPVNIPKLVNITKSVAKSGSKRNKKHRKKLKKLNQLPSPTNHLVSTDNAVIVEGPTDGEQDCQEKLTSPLPAIHENPNEVLESAHEIAFPRDHPMSTTMKLGVSSAKS